MYSMMIDTFFQENGCTEEPLVVAPPDTCHPTSHNTVCIYDQGDIDPTPLPKRPRHNTV